MTTPSTPGESSWLLDAVMQASKASTPSADVVTVMADITIPGKGGPLTPEQIQYLRGLVVYILEGRALAATYNITLLIILAKFTIFHFIGLASNRSRRKALELSGKNVDADDNGQSSSSSSTLDGSVSPTDSVQRQKLADVESQPLLGRRRGRSPSRGGWSHFFKGCLMYQPRPIPLVNKSLPANDTSLVVIGFYIINAIIQFYHCPLDPELLFIAGDRAGLVFVINLPLLYLLAAKNQPIRMLTGYSYETLNILHRRVGELMCLEGLVHGACMIIWVMWTAPGWLQDRFADFFYHPIVILGLIALASYELLYFTSLGSFRQRWYELFLASHVTLQFVALLVLFLHQRNTRPYVGAALLIFICDRLIWRSYLRSATMTADLTVMEDGETVMLSADWDIVSPSEQKSRSWMPRLRKTILHGWLPAEHVFLTVPELGRAHSLQTHPFTIASAAPEQDQDDSHAATTTPPRHAWFSLLIRAQTGFTADLLRHARDHSNTVDVRIDGPYGSRESLEMLHARRTSVLVAGGSGIAVIFPLVWSLARHGGPARRKIHMLWIVHSRSQYSWLGQERLDELRELGVEITLPEPTGIAGRPDAARYIQDLTEFSAADSEDEIGVVVSGPDGLNRSVRNACSSAAAKGSKLCLAVEKFGW